MLLDPGMDLTLRPMRYPSFYERYRDAIKNTWTVEEVDFSIDVNDLNRKMNDSDRHLIHRLVAFFATGDSIVANNLVLNLYKHLNAPEARMYLSRQLFEEALHVQFYLTLLDTYIPDIQEREEAFSAIHNIPSIKMKGDFCFKWINSISHLDECKTREDRQHLPMYTTCGLVDFFQDWQQVQTGCSVTKVDTWHSHLKWLKPYAKKNQICLTTNSKPKSSK